MVGHDDDAVVVEPTSPCPAEPGGDLVTVDAAVVVPGEYLAVVAVRC